MEELAAMTDGGLVFGPVHDEDGKRDTRELLAKPLVGADERGDRDCRSTSCAVSGSLLSASTALGSRERSSEEKSRDRTRFAVRRRAAATHIAARENGRERHASRGPIPATSRRSMTTWRYRSEVTAGPHRRIRD
jgi:hypothetical protein